MSAMGTNTSILISFQELYTILENIEKLKEILNDKLIKMESFLDLLKNSVEGETTTSYIEELKRKTREYHAILYQVDAMISDLQKMTEIYESTEAASESVIPADTIIFDDHDELATTIHNPATQNSVTSDIHYQKATSHQVNKTAECPNKKEPLNNSPTNDSFEYGNQVEISLGLPQHKDINTQPVPQVCSSSIPSGSQASYYSSNNPEYNSTMSSESHSQPSTSATSPVSTLLDIFKAPFVIAGHCSQSLKKKRKKDTSISAEYVKNNNNTNRLTQQDSLCVPKKELTIQSVQFSALAPAKMKKGDYSLIQLLMYEDEYRNVVDRIISYSKDSISETPGGELCLKQQSAIMIQLVSPDIKVAGEMLTLEENRTWQGGYQNFTFAVQIPFDYDKRQIIFKANVYINDLKASSLSFIAEVNADQAQKIKIQRNDILSAFVSYASIDRARVATIIQGMKKARPDLDVFLDVDTLRSGEQWEHTLKKEIANRDIFYLCWSLAAKESKVVEMEWRYALDNRGLEYIEPVPIDPPNICPPPVELSSKHFNDRFLYLINASE